MTGEVLFIQSDDGPPPSAIERLVAKDLLTVKQQVELADGDLLNARGLITTTYLDQIDFLERRDPVRRFLERGGRIVFNGHIVRPFIDGMLPFVPLASRRRIDLELVRLAPHPVFADVPIATHQAQMGVSGFYGRGHNPPLAGAIHLTGIGPERLPVDWEWLLPQGGGLFVHAGNDLWHVSDDQAVNDLMAERLVAWAKDERRKLIAA
jgi:hypothetical protein